MSHVQFASGVAESLPVVSRYSHAFSGALEGEVLQARVPAAFADSPSEHLRATYTFIPTAKVISALQDVGFLAVEARQAGSREVQERAHLGRDQEAASHGGGGG